MTGILEIKEDDTYYYDPEAADRPIRFIQRFCKHYEGLFAGQPFILHPAQRQIVQDIYGWKDRATDYRRFTQVWLEGAVGSGKSPLLAAIGLYELVAGGEPGQQIYCLASSFPQARVVFDCAKRFIEQSPELDTRVHVTNYEISHSRTRSRWQVVSGKGRKAGMRPGVVLADEIHEWPSRETYDSLQGRMTKRTQPLFICATNAGESQSSLCWQLHDEAEAVLSGRKHNPHLYPVIWAAEPQAAIDDPDAWRAANPLTGTTISESKIRQECDRAKGDTALEARFRRLYLSSWVQQGNKKWLDLPLWDACAQPLDRGAVKDLPLYIGLDLSMKDDLCAATFVWVAPDRFHVFSHFWIPEETAAKYEQRNATPYHKWGEAGHITILPESTISPAVKQRIAAYVIDATKGHQVKAVCYDRYKADECIATIESAGITCVPIAQGYTVSPGCAELDRRLKEGSLAIEPNPVLRMCAEHVEVKYDDRGNYWPVKPNAKNRYAGRRSAKIDGISALVTALTEARRHAFPQKSKQWQGGITLI